MPTRPQETLLLAVFLLIVPVEGEAQTFAESALFCREKARRTQTLDTRGLGVFYCTDATLLTAPLQGAHATARPVFYGAVPLAWGAAAVRGAGYADAYRLTLSQGLIYGLVLGLKHAVGRPRPYVRRALSSRAARYGPSKGEKYQAFPSGHAALSAALVTSWSLSHPKWYVVGPGAAWALGVSLSRLHLGVHYPSDVFAGAVLGVGMAALIHRVRGRLTPRRFRDGAPSPAPVALRIRF